MAPSVPSLLMALVTGVRVTRLPAERFLDRFSRGLNETVETLEIVDGTLQSDWIVVEQTETCIALGTDQPAYLPCTMIVIHAQ